MSRAAGVSHPGRTLQTRVGRRVFILFVVCAMLPVTVLGIASYLNVAASLREQAFDRARLAAKRIGTQLFERFDDLQSSLTAVAANLAERPSARLGEPSAMDARFVAIAVISEGTRLDLRGSLLPVPALSPRQQQQLSSGGTILTVSADTARAILLARNVGTAGNSAGVIWAQLSDDIVDRVLGGEASFMFPGLSCIVLPDGTPLRCLGREGYRNGVFDPALGSEPAGAFSWETDERYLAGFWSLFLDAEFASKDWRIVYSEPEADVLAPLTRFRRTFALTALLALLVVGFLSTGQIRRSLGPLKALREGTERVARLEFDKPVDVKSGDEFEDLAYAFNGMSQGLRDQFVEAARLNQALASSSEEVREREARLAAIFDAATDAIVTVRADGRLESFNHTAERVFGMAEAQAVGRPLNVLFAVPLGTGLGSLPVAGPDLGGPAVEVVALRGDGATFPAEVTFAEAHAGDRTIYTVFVRDISERKRAAEEREQLETQLRHVHKMETVGTLAGGIAHDFNNILTPILGYVDLAIDGGVSATVKEDLQQVHRAAIRAKDLVQQILLFSRRGEKTLSTIELGPIVTEALKLLRASLPATIEIRASIAEHVAPVLGDATQLHQVVMNLCTNASHAMKARGGVLEVRLDVTEVNSAATSALPQFDGDRAIRLVVRDTGQGMDAATLERLFEPFFTTKAAGEGTGLGMSIVHGIIAECGGTITVESTPGVGTTFAIYLPPATPIVEAVEKVVAVRSAPREGHILVVDDDSVVAQVVARMLERLGYDVVQTTSPAEVVGMLAAGKRPFDLVITDQTMPGMTGVQLAEWIRSWHPGIPVLMMSGFSEFGGATGSKELVREVLVKPVAFDVLAAAVGRILDEEGHRRHTRAPALVTAV